MFMSSFFLDLSLIFLLLFSSLINDLVELKVRKLRSILFIGLIPSFKEEVFLVDKIASKFILLAVI